MNSRLLIFLVLQLLISSPVFAKSLTVVTYNVWHGLGEMDGVRLRELERPERRAYRFQWLIRQLRQTRPDIVLLQEVSPVAEYTRRLMRAVPGYDEIHHADNCGFKIAGVGIPSNFHQGLTILAKRELKLERIGYVRLSGNSRCSDNFGWQTTESHIALAARIVWSGKAILVLNTHLSSGVSPTPFVSDELESIRTNHNISSPKWADIMSYLEQGTRRRKKEVERLATWTQTQMANYEGIILGGDLNVEPFADELIPLKDLGLVDVARYMNVTVPTYDVFRNDENIKLERPEPRIKGWGRLSVPAAIKEAIQAIFEVDFYRPKRVDYVFVSNSLTSMLRGTQIYMDHPSPRGYLGSDHVGLLVELTPKRSAAM